MSSAFSCACRALLLVAVGFAVVPRAPAQTVAIAPFTSASQGELDPEVAAEIVDRLLLQTTSIPGIKWIERGTIERILAEQGIAAQGFAHADSTARAGRLLRVDVLIKGTFFRPVERPAFVLLEAVEAFRAEVVARAEIPLSPAFLYDLASRLTPADIDSISRGISPLLAEAFAVINARPKQVLIKMLTLPSFGSNRTHQQFPQRFEAELARRAAATPSQRVLRTDRPDSVTGESELRLLGLVETDATMWERFADHYLWGEYGRGGLRLTLWDGRSERRELTLPLPQDPAALDAFVAAVCDSILDATTQPTRQTPAETSADEQRAELATMLLESARQLSSHPASHFNLKAAERSVLEALFFDPTNLKSWLQLDELRQRNRTGDPLSAEAWQISYRLRVRSRFIVDAQGKIFTGALFPEKNSERGLLSNLFGMAAGRSDLASSISLRNDKRIEKLWYRAVNDVCFETARAAERLATAAPGQEKEFARAAELIFADAFQPGLPRWVYQPDPARIDRIVDVLGSRLKIGRAVREAMSAAGDRKTFSQFTAYDVALEYLRSRGRFEEAALFAILDPGELAQASAELTSFYSPAHDPNLLPVDRSQTFVTDRKRGGIRSLAETDAEGHARAATELKAWSSAAHDLQGEVAKLLAAPSLNSPAVGTAANVRAAMNGGGHRAESAIASADIAGQDSPHNPEGAAFVSAIRSRQWRVVSHLLSQGFHTRAASWPEKSSLTGTWAWFGLVDDYVRPDSVGAAALAEAVAQDQFGLADLLIQNGVRFRADADLGDVAIKRTLRRRSKEGLQRLIAAGALSTQEVTPKTTNYRSPCLAAAVEVRDLDLLRMLLDAGANVSDALFSTNARNKPGRGIFHRMEKRFSNAITYAASVDWADGVSAMLKAPSFKEHAVHPLNSPLEDWPHSFASDPALRGQLLKASLIAYVGGTNAQPAPGVDLFSAISANNTRRVSAAWIDTRVRHFRLAGYSALTFAIRENRPEIARWLVHNDAPVNEVDIHKMTPLGHAVAAGDVALVRLLADKGADVNAGSINRSRYPVAPLVHAIKAGDEAMALALIKLGASVSSKTGKPEDDPLFEAVNYNMVPVVDRLLAMGASLRTTYDNVNLLFPAALSNNPALIERCFQAGCPMTARNARGETPLMLAALAGAARSTAKLLALGARDPKMVERAHDLERSATNVRIGERASFNYGSPWRPAHFEPDVVRCVVLLAQYGQLPNGTLRDIKDFYGCFGASGDGESLNEVRAFVAAGGSLNAFVRDGYFRPLSNAVYEGDYEHVKTFIELGVPVSPPPYRARKKGAPLHPSDENMLVEFAARLAEPSKFHILKLLLTHGADAKGSSTLATALSHHASPSSVRLLLDHGAVMDAAAIKAFGDLIAGNPRAVVRIEPVLTPDESRQLRSGTR